MICKSNKDMFCSQWDIENIPNVLNKSVLFKQKSKKVATKLWKDKWN